jgi:hypothetical protein
VRANLARHTERGAFHITKTIVRGACVRERGYSREVLAMWNDASLQHNVEEHAL